jgi:hypothetical protein
MKVKINLTYKGRWFGKGRDPKKDGMRHATTSFELTPENEEDEEFIKEMGNNYEDSNSYLEINDTPDHKGVIFEF